MLDLARKAVVDVVVAWGWSVGVIADRAIVADRENGTDKALSGHLFGELIGAVGDGLLRDDEAMWRATEAFIDAGPDEYDSEERQDLRDRVEAAVAAAFGREDV